MRSNFKRLICKGLLASLVLVTGELAVARASLFAMDASGMEAYVSRCAKVPSPAQMTEAIRSKLAARASVGPEARQRSSYILDGLPLGELSAADFNVIRNLTFDRAAMRPKWKDDYPVSIRDENGVKVFERFCRTETCAKSKNLHPVNLSNYVDKKRGCGDALCWGQRIFGEEKGTMILWAYLEYGINLSPLSDLSADPQGFDRDSLEALLLTFQSVPEHLRKDVLEDTGFFRVRRGKIDTTVYATAWGAVYDPIDEVSQKMKTYLFFHELGHRASNAGERFLDHSEAWLKAAAWEKKSLLVYKSTNSNSFASSYASKDPGEDFAESFGLYRFNPQKLKALSPERYEYMRDQVFAGVEYTADLCVGQKAAASAASGASRVNGVGTRAPLQ